MSEIIFRRIRGRVVPMRLNKEQKAELKSGAKYLGGGIAGSAASGLVFRAAADSTIRKARVASAIAVKAEKSFLRKTQLSFDDALRAKNYSEKSAKIMGSARKSARALLRGQKAVLGIGSLAAGIGIGKIAGVFAPKKARDEVESVASIGGAAAVGAFNAGAFPKESAKLAVDTVKKVFKPKNIVALLKRF